MEVEHVRARAATEEFRSFSILIYVFFALDTFFLYIHHHGLRIIQYARGYKSNAYRFAVVSFVELSLAFSRRRTHRSGFASSLIHLPQLNYATRYITESRGFRLLSLFLWCYVNWVRFSGEYLGQIRMPRRLIIEDF